MEYNDNELIYMIKEDEEVLSIMVEKYEPLFRKMTSSFLKCNPNKGLDYDDLMQQCRIILCSAVDRYNVNNETIFYTFLLACLKRGLYNYIRKDVKKPEIVSYMDEKYESYYNNEKSDFNVENMLIDKENNELIKNFSYSLEDIDHQIFELRLNNFSYQEISTLLDINQKKVDNSLVKTRKKLEKYLLNLS